MFLMLATPAAHCSRAWPAFLVLADPFSCLLSFHLVTPSEEPQLVLGLASLLVLFGLQGHLILFCACLYLQIAHNKSNKASTSDPCQIMSAYFFRNKVEG